MEKGHLGFFVAQLWNAPHWKGKSICLNFHMGGGGGGGGGGLATMNATSKTCKPLYHLTYANSLDLGYVRPSNHGRHARTPAQQMSNIFQ